jgi:uncharacterized protein YraI
MTRLAIAMGGRESKKGVASVTRARFVAVLAVQLLIAASALGTIYVAAMPRTPVDARTGGVPGCTEKSHRTVVIPAGSTTAFSCPTHIEVSSMDEHTPTIVTFGR